MSPRSIAARLPRPWRDRALCALNAFGWSLIRLGRWFVPDTDGLRELDFDEVEGLMTFERVAGLPDGAIVDFQMDYSRPLGRGSATLVPERSAAPLGTVLDLQFRNGDGLPIDGQGNVIQPGDGKRDR
jgi:hypothetical protein